MFCLLLKKEPISFQLHVEMHDFYASCELYVYSYIISWAKLFSCICSKEYIHSIQLSFIRKVSRLKLGIAVIPVRPACPHNPQVYSSKRIPQWRTWDWNVKGLFARSDCHCDFLVWPRTLYPWLHTRRRGGWGKLLKWTNMIAFLSLYPWLHTRGGGGGSF